MAFTFIPAPGGKRGGKMRFILCFFFWKFHVFFLAKPLSLTCPHLKKGQTKTEAKENGTGI